MSKSSRKSSKARGRPFTKGDPRRVQARGPKRGAPNAGRPPDEWRERLRAMASRDEVLEHVNAVLLEGPDHPFFDRALQYVTDHGYGKANQPVDLAMTVSIATAIEAARARAKPPSD